VRCKFETGGRRKAKKNYGIINLTTSLHFCDSSSVSFLICCRVNERQTKMPHRLLLINSIYLSLTVSELQQLLFIQYVITNGFGINWLFIFADNVLFLVI